MKSSTLIWGCLLLLMVGLGIWAYEQIEWVETEVDLGPTEAANRQPFLAAQRLLETRQQQVVIERGLSRLDSTELRPMPPSVDTIVLIDSFGMLSQSRAERLMEWVHDGGRLIMSAENPYISSRRMPDDPIFDEFEVDVSRDLDAPDSKDLDEGDEDDQADNEPDDESEEIGFSDLLHPKSACDNLTDEIRFTFDGDSEQVAVVFPSYDALGIDEDAAYAWLADDWGVQFAQYDWGDGMVTLVTTANLWNNRYIGCLDHAYALTQLTGPKGNVWFLVNQDAPSLWELLKTYAWLLMLAGTLLLVAVLWHKGIRFGPVIPAHMSQRRKLMEHIDAGSAFLWRHKSSVELLAPLRQQVRERAEQRLLGYERLDDSSRYAELAQIAHLPAAQIEEALVATAQDETMLIRMVSTLKHLKDLL